MRALEANLTPFSTRGIASWQLAFEEAKYELLTTEVGSFAPSYDLLDRPTTGPSTGRRTMNTGRLLIAALLTLSAANAFAQKHNTNSALNDGGERAARVGEKAAGINNPPTAQERVREAARDAGARAGGSKSHADSYKSDKRK